jgi:hypothetical protein
MMDFVDAPVLYSLDAAHAHYEHDNLGGEGPSSIEGIANDGVLQFSDSTNDSSGTESDDSPHASPNITDEASADTLASTRFEVGYEQLQSSSSNASTTTANRRVRFSILRRRREAASEQRMRLHIITRTNQILPQMADQEASVADRAARTAETTTANRRARHQILRARGPAPRVANHRR